MRSQKVSEKGKEFFKKTFHSEEEAYHNVPLRASRVNRKTTQSYDNQNLVAASIPARHSAAKGPYNYTETPVKVKSKQGLLPLPSLALGMVLMLAIITLGNPIIQFFQSKYYDSHYGMPRTFQIDAVVNHNDSKENPSHFIDENLNGQIVIIEISAGKPQNSHIYLGPVVYSQYIPSELEFKDLDGDGYPDMIIKVFDGSSNIHIMMNNHKIFDPTIKIPINAVKNI